MKYKPIIISLCIFIPLFLFMHCNASSEGINPEDITPSELNQRMAQIFDRQTENTRRNLSLPESQEIPGKCATPLIRFALAHEEWLDTENLFLLHRPDSTSYVRYYSPDNKVYWTYSTTHFKIHYGETGSNAVYGSDGIQSTIPEYVTSFGSYFEQAWNHSVNVLGYTPPLSDGSNGGDSRFDVYILGITYYGYTSVENGHPFIVVHKDYSGFESNQDPGGFRAGNMKVTAAHEFFHAIQYFYDDWNDDCIWWEENTAVWMEDEVFDNVDAYLNYLGTPFDDLNHNLMWDTGEPWYNPNGTVGGTSGRESDVWYDAPHISLDTRYTSAFDRYEYGGVIWAKYLAKRFGNDFIKQSFVIADYNTDALTAIQETLEGYETDLHDAFTDFRVKVLKKEYFEEGDKYPLIQHQGNYGSYPVSLTANDMSHLACRYIGLKPPEGDKKIIVEANGDDGADFGIALVLTKANGDYVTHYIPFTNQAAQVGRIEVLSFGTQGLFRSATLIPMNLSTNQDYKSISLFVQIEGLFQYSLRLREGINLVSLPTNLAGASTSYEFVETYFDSAERLQFFGYDPGINLWQITYMDSQPKGILFPIDWLKGYVLSVPQDMTLALVGDPPNQDTMDLLPGHNMISTFITETDTLSSAEILYSADQGSGIVISINRHNPVKGKWESGYRFFGRYAGDALSISKGEAYIVDMNGEHKGWEPPAP